MYANAQRWVFRAALNDSNESLEVTETGNAFQTVAAACIKQSLHIKSVLYCRILHTDVLL